MKTFSEDFNTEDNSTIIGAAFIADKGIEGATWLQLVDFFYINRRISLDEKSELIKFLSEHHNPIALKENDTFKNLIIPYLFCDTFHSTDKGIKILFSGLSSLIDFIELKHARQNSIDARRYSIIAIIISILALFYSIYFGEKQLNTNIKFDEKQLQSILSTNKNQIDSLNQITTKINDKLDLIYFNKVNKKFK